LWTKRGKSVKYAKNYHNINKKGAAEFDSDWRSAKAVTLLNNIQNILFMEIKKLLDFDKLFDNENIT
jgi:hypothetical protein